MIIWLGLFGGLGAVMRYSLSELINAYIPLQLKFLSILFVNLVGCFLLGVLLNSNVEESIIYILSVGFLGAFTTFSTFSFEVLEMLKGKKWVILTIYMSGTLFLGILSFKIGQNLVNL